MEPPSATARMTNSKWEIWTSVQSPGGARDDIAKRLGVEPKNVTLHNMLPASYEATLPPTTGDRATTANLSPGSFTSWP